MCMHLTNYCLNKEHENWINPQEYGEENRGPKRLMSVFFKQLEKESGFDSEKCKEQIKSTVRKTVISILPYLKNYAKKMMNADLKKLKVFQLIGFDVMLDHN